MSDSVAYLFKVVFLGDPAVGKTSLVGRYVYDSFEHDYLTTIGTDIHVKLVDLGDISVKLVIWDIGGQDDFKQLRKAYYQNASGAFFVFDTTRPETLDRVDDWLGALFEVTEKIPLVMCENKIDLVSEVSRDRVDKLVERYDIDFVRTSAKEDTNVEAAFTKMTKEMIERARKRKRV
ncbi:MAG: Rab family GTPase [Promethearchaeia archaeon]